MTASRQIDEIIEGLADWRGPVLARVRAAILRADPAVTEEVKWRGAPVWSLDGTLCLAGAFKDKVKVTFSNGAKLSDPRKLFNNGLAGGQWRAIDVFEDSKIDEKALTALVRSAIEFNRVRARAKPAGRKKGGPAPRSRKPRKP
jgi:hypothetical protein